MGRVSQKISIFFHIFFQNIKARMKMVKNRRRKRIGSTTKLSISRDSMRPYIKEIEKLRAENYLLQQKKTQSLTQPQKIREFSEFESSVLEYKIQLDHKNYECSRLLAENESLKNEIEQQRSDNLKIANETAKFKAEKNAEFEQILLAKQLLSSSLQELITDYRYLEAESRIQKTNFEQKEILMRNELEELKSSCKDGVIKIAETAKTEIERLLQENYNQKKILNEILYHKTVATD